MRAAPRLGLGRRPCVEWTRCATSLPRNRGHRAVVVRAPCGRVVGHEVRLRRAGGVGLPHGQGLVHPPPVQVRPRGAHEPGDEREDLLVRGSPVEAAAFVLGDFDTASNNVEHFYWAQSGAITLTAVSENDAGAIDGSVNATNFADVDEQGNVIASGCTTSMGGLQFALTQMAMAKPGSLPKPGDADAPFTREQIEKMLKIAHDRVYRHKQ